MEIEPTIILGAIASKLNTTRSIHNLEILEVRKGKYNMKSSRDAF